MNYDDGDIFSYIVIIWKGSPKVSQMLLIIFISFSHVLRAYFFFLLLRKNRFSMHTLAKEISSSIFCPEILDILK